MRFFRVGGMIVTVIIMRRCYMRIVACTVVVSVIVTMTTMSIVHPLGL